MLVRLPPGWLSFGARVKRIRHKRPTPRKRVPSIYSVSPLRSPLTAPALRHAKRLGRARPLRCSSLSIAERISEGIRDGREVWQADRTLCNFDVPDRGENGFPWRLSPMGALAPNWRMKSRKQRVRAPEFVSPRNATLVDRLPTGAEWLYEVKWDGYRALAAKHGDSVRLLSLKNKNLTPTFQQSYKLSEMLPLARCSSTARSSQSTNRDPLPFRCFNIARRSDEIGRSSITLLTF